MSKEVEQPEQQSVQPQAEQPREIKVSARAYEQLQDQTMKIASVVVDFPFQIVVAGIERMQEICLQHDKEPEVAKICEGIAKYKGIMIKEIALSLQVAQIGVQKAREAYMEEVKKHPEWQSKSGLVVPKNAGRIIIAGE